MTLCRTAAEAFSAGCADAADDPPLSQETADRAAAILLASTPVKQRDTPRASEARRVPHSPAA